MFIRLVVLVVLTTLVSSGAHARSSGSKQDAGTPLDSGPRPGTGEPTDAGPPRDAWVAPGPLVDPHCIDGLYAETLPPSSVAIQDLISAYAPANVGTFVDQLLARRYPFGQRQVTEARPMRDCVTAFLADASTPEAVIVLSLDTIVHECGHIVDFGRSVSPVSTYVINPTLVLRASRGDTTARGGLTFARSELLTDAYQSLRPPCGAMPSLRCDEYAALYLTGFSGTQGFNTVLEEAVQYTNSLATAYALNDIAATSGERTSQRDGILTFLWYIERYLHLARASDPAAYDLLLNGSTGQWRQAILTVWGRAWLFLNATQGMSALGIGDAMIEALVMDPVLLDEINRLRRVECP